VDIAKQRTRGLVERHVQRSVGNATPSVKALDSSENPEHTSTPRRARTCSGFPERKHHDEAFQPEPTDPRQP
jgi:hypothetical protein